MNFRMAFDIFGRAYTIDSDTEIPLNQIILRQTNFSYFYINLYFQLLPFLILFDLKLNFSIQKIRESEKN